MILFRQTVRNIITKITGSVTFVRIKQTTMYITGDSKRTHLPVKHGETEGHTDEQ